METGKKLIGLVKGVPKVLTKVYSGLSQPIVKKISIALSLILFPLAVISQQLTYSEIKELRVKYPNHKTVCLKKQVTVDFFVPTKENDKLYARIKTKEVFVNLFDNVTLHKKFYYDEYSTWNKDDFRTLKITKKEAKTGKKIKDINDEKIAISGIFYHDLRALNYSFSQQEYAKQYGYSAYKIIKDLKYLTSYYISENYPIEECEVNVIVPENVELNILEFNFNEFDQTKISDNTYNYKFKNIHAYSREKHQPGISFINPHLIFNIKSYNINNKEVELFSSSDDLYDWYQTLTNGINSEVNQNSELKSKVTFLTKNKNSNIEKVKSIFYWVQDNIKYIAFENGIAGFKPENASNVFYNRYGDCKGMANLLSEMLKLADFDSRLTWLGTRNLNYNYSIPSLCVDNHMIVSLFINDSLIYLDPTEKYISINNIAERIQGREVMIENGKKPLYKQIPTKSEKQNKFILKKTISINNKLLTGHIDKAYSGEEKAQILYAYNKLRNESKKETIDIFLTEGNGNISIEHVTSSGFENRDNELQFGYDYEEKNNINIYDDKIYLNIDQNKSFENYSIDTSRVNDYLFNNKYFEEINTILTIPQNKIIEYTPSNLEIVNDDYEIIINYQILDDVLIYQKILKIKNSLLKKEKFSVWNNHVQQLIENYNDSVVLKNK